MDTIGTEKGSTAPVRLADGVYWVGYRFAKGPSPDSPDVPMDCNPYLIVDGGEAVLIDPGSVLDFDRVFSAVSSLVSPQSISLVVAHHQDPDICASLPLFAKAGVAAPIAMHWRASLLARHYGAPNDFYIVNERGWEWRFRSGRILRFLPAPYCHCAGCIMTWDATSHVLFSSDIFGSIIHSPELFAGPSYDVGMRAFHEHYMPSRAALGPVVRSLLPLDIAVIAPQHGCVLVEGIRERILELSELECGTYIDSLGQGLPSGEGPQAGEIDTGAVRVKAGAQEPSKRESIETRAGLESAGAYRLRLEALLQDAPSAGSGAGTGQSLPGAETFGALYFSVDNLEEINQFHGRKAGDEALEALAYIIRNSAPEGAACSFYMLDRPYIACLTEGIAPEGIHAMAERVRYHASISAYADEQLTVSAAIVYGNEPGLEGGNNTPEGVDRALLARLFKAKRSAAGGICDRIGNEEENSYLRRKILLVEPDDAYVRFLSPFFESRGYFLVTTRDGSDVPAIDGPNAPDLIIAEAMAPRVNGFELRERMIVSGEGKSIPFILISRRKDEAFIRRAVELGIVHFLKKPFSKTELLGLVDNLLKEDP